MREISSFHVDRLAERAQRDAAAAAPLTSPFDGAGPALLDAVAAAVDDLSPALLELSHELHADPEVAYCEHRAVTRVVALLEREQITAETAVAGIPTALRAEAGEGGRTIGVLAEYDALPGIGHACGHNIICAAGVGAFLAVARVLRATRRPGRAVLYGCPAEEGHSGKEVMIRGGAFRELDAAIMVHPFGWDAADMLWLGRRSFRARWRGVAAHASSQPSLGRNALDAASLAYQGLGLLRQQVSGADRLHAIISGGDRASIIPETATMQGYVRSPHAAALADLSARVDDVLRGAALMAGVDVDVEWDDVPPSLPLRTNLPLAACWSDHQVARGRTPLPPGVVPDALAASTDFGNVSHLVPGIHPVIACAPRDCALHTRELAACAGAASGDEAVLDAAHGLAATALDLLVDDALAAAVAADFAAQGGPVLAADVLADRDA